MVPKIKLCTSTLYREGDNVRVDLCLEMIENAQKLGLELVLVDAGSTNKKFLEALNKVDPSLIRVVKTKECGFEPETMGEPRRLAFYLAAGGSFDDWVGFKQFYPNEEYDYYDNVNPKEDDYYLWLEPEKAPLVSESNIEILKEATMDGEADVVVPRRDVDAMKTLPPYQMYAETSANWEVNKRLRDSSPGYMDTDLWFGPKLFNKNGLKEFLDYRGQKWDCIITPVAEAVKKGLKVASAFVDFVYPPEQTAEENDSEVFEMKRIYQYEYIINTIVRALRPNGGVSAEIR